MRAIGYGRSVIGSREINQDSYTVRDDLGFYAVADGVGGGMKGEVASSLAVEGVQKQIEIDGNIRAGFEAMQDVIYKQAMAEFGEPIMGTTLTVVRVNGAQVSLCHAGDSRCYLFDGNILRQLTEDHESFDERYQGTVLGSYLGIPPDVQPITIQEETLMVQSGNRLLICSDGLYRQISEPRLVALIRQEVAIPDPETLLKLMCQEASQAEFSDNVTAVYVVFE